jgi:hypothetical protein
MVCVSWNAIVSNTSLYPIFQLFIEKLTFRKKVHSYCLLQLLFSIFAYRYDLQNPWNFPTEPFGFAENALEITYLENIKKSINIFLINKFVTKFYYIVEYFKNNVLFQLSWKRLKYQIDEVSKTNIYVRNLELCYSNHLLILWRSRLYT